MSQRPSVQHHLLCRSLALALSLTGFVGLGFPQETNVKVTPETLTLQDSLDKAMQNNPRVLIAQQDLAIAKADVRQAKSLFYPNVSLGVNYIRYRNETLGITSPELGGVILEAPIATPSGVRGNPLADNLYLGRLGFRQTLYSGGRITSTYKLSTTNLTRAENAVESLKREITFETTKGFYSLLAIQLKEDLIKHVLEKINSIGNQTGDGVTALYAVKSAAELRVALSQLEEKHKKIRFDYLQSMGVELFNDIVVDGSLDVVPLAVDLQKVLVWAKQNRPELKETQRQEEVDRLAVNLSMAERYPVFILGGGYEIRNNQFPPNQTNKNENNWNAGISMNIPVFDGFSSLAQIRRSKSRAEQGRFKRVQLEDQIEKEVRSAYADYVHWAEELQWRKKERDQLKELEKKRASVGAKTTRDRMDLLRWNLDLELNVIDARCELSISQAQLEAAIGRPLSQ